jgi:hypothetical protein
MRVHRMLLALATASSLAGCEWITGPDCGAACDKAASCQGLTKTFFLSCNTFLGECTNQVADCAACIDSPHVTCGELISGRCDPVCLVPDAGP